MKTWQRLGQILTQKTTEGLLPVDLADAMWLAAHWGQFELAEEPVEEKPNPTTPKSKPESEPAPTAPNSEREAVQKPIPETPSLSEQGVESGDEHFDMQLPSDSAEKRPRITCPAPPALTHKNKLAKAIRLFHQRQPSRFRTVIDELATVEFIAEQNCWEPVLGWESERRFEVALVVEKSVAMGFWHNVVTELKQLLTRKRMFRDVRVWSLRKGNSGLEILPGLNQTVGGWRSPSALVEPTGRRLILLVSDCVSKGWYDGSVAQQISKWSRYMPVALLQMLPEKLWQRTGLGAAVPIQVLPRSVGIRSIPFKAEISFMFDEEQLDDGALLPIAIIEPWPLEQLAGLIAGINVQGAPGFYLPNKPEVGGEFEDGGEKESRLDRFWRTASPDARRLAKLLAAAPRIRLPIVRLVRAAMLKDATHVHEAEFFLSGLLEVTHEPDGGVYPDRVDYDFVAGVREELLDSLSVIDARLVLEKVSLYVEEHLGEATGFAAVLANPTGDIDSVKIGELSESFATVATSVLERLGGRFKRLVKQVEFNTVLEKNHLENNSISTSRIVSVISLFPFIIELSVNLLKEQTSLLRLIKQFSVKNKHEYIITDKDLKEVGQALWQALDIDIAFDKARKKAGLQILPIIIYSDSNFIQDLPWEYLYHPEDGFIAKHLGYSLSRQLLAQDNKNDLPKGPLEVLLFTSQPYNLDMEKDRLDVETEQTHILEALDHGISGGLVKLTAPDDGRFSTFKDLLLNKIFHLVFISGHSSSGSFLFEGEDGSGELVDNAEITQLFKGTQVQCVVLSTGGSLSLAMKLSKINLTHVVSMQAPILDKTGILFSHTFCQAILRKKRVDIAVQQARYEIDKNNELPDYINNELPGYISQWQMPILITRNPMQNLIDWDFTLQPPKSKAFFVNSLADNITLPPVFIGRRKELRELGQALSSGKMQRLLLTGPGGQGKTALAGQLVSKLEQQGYLVHAYSVRPSESSWENFVFHLKSSLNDRLLEKVERRWTLCVNELQRAQLLLNALVQKERRVLLFDNLENVQEPKTGELTDEILLTWLQAAQNFPQILILLTSRWAIPGVDSYPLAKPSYGDFLRYIQELQLDVANKRDLYAALGGNFKGLQLFHAAQQLGIGHSAFLERVQTAQRDLQVYMAVEQVVGYLRSEERVLLERLPVYTTPVTEMGVKAIAGDLVAPLEVLQRLVNLALVDVEIAVDLNKRRVYQISPLVAEWLQKQQKVSLFKNSERFNIELRRKAAEHQKWLFDHGLNTISQRITVHEALQLAEQQEEANQFALENIVPYLDLHGLYRTLLDKWLPALRESSDRAIQSQAFNWSGQVCHAIGDYDTGLNYLQQSLSIILEISDRGGEGSTLNHISQIYYARGDYETALDYMQQSLKIGREIGDKKSEGGTLDNISQVYQARGNYETALDYLQQSLAIRREIGDKQGEGSNLNNISQIYHARGDYDTALDYLQQSLTIRREIGDSAGLCSTLFNIGHIHFQRNNKEEAMANWISSYEIAKKIGNAQALDALEKLAKELGGKGLDMWEKN